MAEIRFHCPCAATPACDLFHAEPTNPSFWLSPATQKYCGAAPEAEYPQRFLHHGSLVPELSENETFFRIIKELLIVHKISIAETYWGTRETYLCAGLHIFLQWLNLFRRCTAKAYHVLQLPSPSKYFSEAVSRALCARQWAWVSWTSQTALIY